jgi:hypothetical protein
MVGKMRIPNLRIDKEKKMVVLEKPKKRDTHRHNKKNPFVPIETLRKMALEKIKSERVDFTPRDIAIINNVISGTICQSKYDSFIGVCTQIRRDISLKYKKWDCIARWLDCDLGLAKDEPNMIRKIATLMGIMDKQKV